MRKPKLKNIHYGTLLLLMLFLLIGPSIFKIQYQSEITDYFDSTDPKLVAFQSAVDEFQLGTSPTVIIQLDHEALLSQEAILDLYTIATGLESISSIDTTQSLLDTPLTDPTSNTMTTKQAIKNGMQIDDVVLGQLADNAAQHFFIAAPKHSMATIAIDLNDNDKYTDIENYFQSQNQVTIRSFYITGPQEIKKALHTALIHDVSILMPLVLIIGLIFLWYFLRSWWLIFAGVASIIVALGITAGITGYFGIVINQTSSLAFSIVFIIALADIIHLLVGYRQRLSDKTSLQAIAESLAANASPLLLTSITTCIGFLSLNTSHSPVFATFGNIAAIGVIFAYVSAVTITVSLVILRPISNNAQAIQPLTTLVSYFSQFGTHLNNQTRTGFYLLCVAAGLGIFWLNPHNDPIDYFPEDFDIKQSSQVSNDVFGVHHPLYLHINTQQKYGLLEQPALNTLKEFRYWVEANPNITGSHSFINSLELLLPSIREHDFKWVAPPSNNQAAVDLINLQDMGKPSDKAQSSHVDANYTSMLLTLATKQLSSNELIQLEQNIQHWFESNAPTYQVTLTGHGMLFASIGKTLTYNMLLGGLMSAFIICILIGVFLRNVRMAVIALIPNLIPATVIFGLWGFLFGKVDLAAAGTLSISLGIVVDDSIHILKHYLAYRKAGKTPQQCSQLTLQQVGPALLLTTGVLSIGMGILMFSVFGPNQTTAIFLTAIISTALLFDLIMLPHLLQVFDKWLFPHTTLMHNDAYSISKPRRHSHTH